MVDRKVREPVQWNGLWVSRLYSSSTAEATEGALEILTIAGRHLTPIPTPFGRLDWISFGCSDARRPVMNILEGV